LSYEKLQEEIRIGVDSALIKLESSNEEVIRVNNIYKAFHNVSIFLYEYWDNVVIMIQT